MSPDDGVPILKLVRTEQVRFHEHPEGHRALRLRERLRTERLLRHPPIVAALPGERYMLLDGANRVRALGELGYSHAPVQVIDYGDPAVRLKGWHHLLLEGGPLDLRAAYAAIPGVRVREVAEGDLTNLLELRRVFAVLVDEAARCWGLFAERDTFDLRRWIQVLDAVVSAYEGRTPLERIKLADFSKLPHVFEAVAHQLVLFPVLTKSELLHLASESVLIPTGISRHLIPGRALGLHLDLAFLESKAPEADLQAHFAHFLEQLEMQGKIRFYEESVFIMNE